MIGKTINHYRVLEKLGAGGMGEVYLAEDGKLNRKVALKVLPPEMAGSADRLERFEREAKAIASLNHPNIITIHSIEQSEGGGGGAAPVHFLTMELVAGCPLSAVIPKGGLDLRRILDFGLAMTEAMTAAHEKDITHRDLKPDNIMVSDDGRIKILDFGLAKLREESPGGGPAADRTSLPTQTVRTEDGRILGTVAYMAPEQAEGKPVDPRTDVFAMGVLLYEMATGERPFKGDSKISVISSIMRDTPVSVTELNRELPRHLGRIIKRCLAKNPDRRYGNAKELYNDLLELKDEFDSGELLAPAGAVALPTSKRTGFLPGLAAGALIVAVLALVTVALLIIWAGPGPSPSATTPLRTTVARITDQVGYEADPAISPDGRSVAYSAPTAEGDWDIYLQRIEGGNILNLTPDTPDSSEGETAFSPDGERIAFISDRDGAGIYLMAALGGSVTRLTDTGFHPAWSADGSEVFYDTEDWHNARSRGGNSRIETVNVSTGTVRVVHDATDAVDPAPSPHGHRVAFWGLRTGSGRRDIWTVPAGGGDPVPVTDDAATDWSPIWAPDGGALYFISDRGGSFNIWWVPIDERTGAVRGEMQPVTSGTSDINNLSISADGRRLVYVVPDITNNLWRAPFDPGKPAVAGSPERLTHSARNMNQIDLSPDEQWIAYNLWTAQEDIIVERLDGSGRRQLTDDAAKDRGPRWSPDGRTIAFYSDRSGTYEIWTVQADGRNLNRITDDPDTDNQQPGWSPDGTRLVYHTPTTPHLIDMTKPFLEQTPFPLPAWDGKLGIFDPTEAGEWSPDGRYLLGAFLSRDRPTGTSGARFVAGGLYDVEKGEYVRLIESGKSPVEVAGTPLWFSDSRRLLLPGEGGKLYVFDIEGREFTEVQGWEKKEIFELTRLGDGDRTLFWIETSREGDVWMLEVE